MWCRRTSREAKVGERVYEELSLPLRSLRDMLNVDIEKVRVDSRETMRTACVKFVHKFMPKLDDRIEHYDGERPIFDLYGVEDEMQRALKKEVPLKSGGYLVVDQTEAMTTIDVNTGAYPGPAQPRGNRLPHQPGGRAGGGAAAAPAQPGRHHHHRLHRHGRCRASAPGAAHAGEGAGARPRQDHRVRLLAAGPGGDDAQAHRRERSSASCASPATNAAAAAC